VENSAGDIRVLVSFQQSGAGVYYSDDGGATYTESPVSGSYHPDISARWGAESPMVYLATDNGIYRSTDMGENFISCPGSSGLMWSVQGSLDDNVFAGTNGTGVRWSPDLGDNWQLLNTGIENRVVWDIAYGGNGNQIFAGLRGFGVVELTDDQLGIQTGTDNGNLSIFPSSNPVTSSVGFTLTGMNGAPAEIVIYSSAGRIVHRETVACGETAVWTPEQNVPSGVYLVRAFSEGDTAHAKLVLVR
jgi:hypothetical protein